MTDNPGQVAKRLRSELVHEWRKGPVHVQLVNVVDGTDLVDLVELRSDERLLQVVEDLARQTAVRYGGERLFDPGLEDVELVLRLDGQGHRLRAVVTLLEGDQHLVDLVVLKLEKYIPIV